MLRQKKDSKDREIGFRQKMIVTAQRQLPGLEWLTPTEKWKVKKEQK